jgi:uncharacterized protein YigE (DUF2233 family)
VYVRIGRTRLALCLVALTVLTGSASAFGTEPAGASVVKVVLAPGVTMTKITLSSGPVRIRVLTIDPRKAAMVTSTLAGQTFGQLATVSSMGQAHGAVAAVNGDYGVWPARPIHSFTHNGSLYDTGSLDSAFAVSADETHAFAARVSPHVVGAIAGSGSAFTVDTWNAGKPSSGQVAGYTPVGGSVSPPPSSGCFARLVPSGGMSWGTGHVGITRQYTVDAMACQSSRLAMNGDVLLVSTRTGTGATTVQSLVPGTGVALTWTMGTWSDIASSVGGGPPLVAGGTIVAPKGCGSLCSLNPRTGVGVTATGRILLVTVDGRNPGWSIGMTLSDFAAEMKQLGAVNAINLDGGGSSTMWTKKFGLVNEPTDCLPSICQRSISNAILVLPRTASGPPIAQPAVATPAAALAAWQRVVADPGSTGGYLDAASRGVLGRVLLPAADRRIAGAFRRSSAG